MIVRDFQPEDLECYLAYSKDFYAGGAVLHPVDEQNFRNTFQECLKRGPYTRGLMLTEGDVPVGYALLSFTWSNEVGGQSVLFEELYIAPRHRGERYGTQFIQWMLQEYPNAKRFRLEVCADNTGARRLYDRMGFGDLGYLQMIRDR